MIEKIKNIVYKITIGYPVPLNINIFWNLGILGLLFLVVQIITGIFLAMHYIGNVEWAFKSVENIMRDVNMGWCIRYIHANGASMFFFVIYIHVFRGVFYSSYVYPRQYVWIIGVIILLIMILTAFLGYVLPWGQMSFWAATVITNLATAIPGVGVEIVNWLWGGYAVGNPTLNRFYSLHYIFPIIIVLLVIIHIILLHLTWSNNPVGVQPDIDETKFGIYFIIKDMFGIYIIIFIYSLFLFFYPNVLSHSDNYIPANSLVTPNHIVPEWYFLPFYAILRSVPDKLIGVLLLLASIIVLVFLPYIIAYEVRNTNLKTSLRFLFYFFFFNCLILGWIGSKDITTPFYEIGQVSTIFYFGYFLVLLPFIHRKI